MSRRPLFSTTTMPSRWRTGRLRSRPARQTDRFGSPPGRSNADEPHLGVCQRSGRVVERERAAGRSFVDEFLQPGLEEGASPRQQAGDHLWCAVDADDPMSQPRQSSGGDEADTAGTNHNDAHLHAHSSDPEPQGPACSPRRRRTAIDETPSYLDSLTRLT